MSGASEDRLLGGRVVFRQPLEGYRAAIDPLLLAAAVPAQPGERVLELGCGAGAVFLCLLARVGDLRVMALERDEELVRLARLNAAANGWADRAEVVQGAVGEWRPAGAPFDQVVFNPPFLESGRAQVSGIGRRDSANIEGEAGLTQWIDAALAALKPKGRLTLIQRADRLGDILGALAGRAGEVVVFPLWPKAGRPAKRVIVTARKGVASPLVLAAGLVLHEKDGGYSPQAYSVLRAGAALPLLPAT